MAPESLQLSLKGHAYCDQTSQFTWLKGMSAKIG